MSTPEPTSRIELSRAALARNLHFIRRWIGPDVLFSSVVKGNAYGHGIEEFVPLAEELGVRHFAVFDGFEASRVHASLNHEDSRVMVMGMIHGEDLQWAISSGVELYVFDLHRLRHVTAAARAVERPARVHLEIETGLNRTGFADSDLRDAVDLIRSADTAVEVVGVCTHLAGAESIANYVRIQHQIERFHEVCGDLEASGVRPPLRHMACSAAALTYPETILDMVRIGIVQYGFWPSEETKIHWMRATGRLGDNPLRRLIRWSSRVMSIKHVAAGDYVGYGVTTMASRNMRLAVIPVGYSHGYARSLSNQGRVLVRGKKAGVVGLVNMNLLIVDVTAVPEVAPGDEVVLIGKQGKAAIPVSSFSELSNQLNYELLTRLPRDIPRRVVS